MSDLAVGSMKSETLASYDNKSLPLQLANDSIFAILSNGIC